MIPYLLIEMADKLNLNIFCTYFITYEVSIFTILDMLTINKDLYLFTIKMD